MLTSHSRLLIVLTFEEGNMAEIRRNLIEDDHVALNQENRHVVSWLELAYFLTFVLAGGGIVMGIWNLVTGL